MNVGNALEWIEKGASKVRRCLKCTLNLKVGIQQLFTSSGTHSPPWCCDDHIV